MTTRVPSQSTPSFWTYCPSLLTFSSLNDTSPTASSHAIPPAEMFSSAPPVLRDPTQPQFKVCLKLCLLHDSISDHLQLEEFFFPSAFSILSSQHPLDPFVPCFLAVAWSRTPGWTLSRWTGIEKVSWKIY